MEVPAVHCAPAEPDTTMSGRTLYDKIWDAHCVQARDDGSALIYIDRQLVHEVTSPQAFEGLRLAGRKPWRVSANLAGDAELAMEWSAPLALLKALASKKWKWGLQGLSASRSKAIAKPGNGEAICTSRAR